MNVSKSIWFLISAIIIILVLFDVEFVLNFGTSQVREIPDPAAVSNYERCYQEEDDRIHATAFGTIDNPDVQKEFISANRARAAAECRALFPEVMIRAEEATEFNFVDLQPRFW